MNLTEGMMAFDETSIDPLILSNNESAAITRNTTETVESGCTLWQDPQHLLFQLANTCFCISYLAPNGRFGILFMHGLLIIAFLLFSTWSWNIICAPDVFSWNFSFMLINMGQTIYILYTMREVKIPKELEEIYETMFQPLQVSRLLFKKMIGMEYAQIMSLHSGEAYAMQNLTRTDRLGLLISGKVSVLSDQHFLHHIYPKQFLDSPEFESSRAGAEDKFKVSIIAATNCKYIFWQRQALEYLLIKEAYLANVLSLLVARDITMKLYAMNEKIVTEKGSHLDIRLPSITSSMTSQVGTDSIKSPAARSKSLIHYSLPYMGSPSCGGYRGTNEMGPDSVFDSREKLVNSPLLNNVRAIHVTAPSDDYFTGSSTQSWS